MCTLPVLFVANLMLKCRCTELYDLKYLVGRKKEKPVNLGRQFVCENCVQMQSDSHEGKCAFQI